MLRSWKDGDTDHWVWTFRFWRVQLFFNVMKHHYGRKTNPRWVVDWRVIYDAK